MKSETAADLKRLYEVVKVELEKIRKEREKLSAEEDALKAKAKAFQVLLGLNDSESRPVAEPRSQSSPSLTFPLIPAMIPINQFIADFIASKKPNGTTRKEIADALKTSGYKNHPNYPYVVVTQLKEAGKVIEPEKGSLHWIEPR